MAKGSIAKEFVEKKIAEAFGSDFIGISDKKLYVWANDGGEKVQIAIALTCPKNFIECGSAPVAASAPQVMSNGETPPWEDDPTPVATTTPTEPDQKEMDNLAAMMAKFGL